jgi:hypothetical protein
MEIVRHEWLRRSVFGIKHGSEREYAPYGIYGIPDLQPTPIIIKQFWCASVSHRPQFLMALAHQVID